MNILIEFLRKNKKKKEKKNRRCESQYQNIFPINLYQHFNRFSRKNKRQKEETDTNDTFTIDKYKVHSDKKRKGKKNIYIKYRKLKF